MAKHTPTPGPWFVVHEVILVDHGNGEFPSIASCVGEPNAEANARLIAAAPDLLVALQIFVHAVESGCVDNDLLSACKNADAAIAKATAPIDSTKEAA